MWRIIGDKLLTSHESTVSGRSLGSYCYSYLLAWNIPAKTKYSTVGFRLIVVLFCIFVHELGTGLYKQFVLSTKEYSFMVNLMYTFLMHPFSIQPELVRVF